MCLCSDVFMCVLMNVGRFVCMQTCVYVCRDVCIGICVWRECERETEIERQRESVCL